MFAGCLQIMWAHWQLIRVEGGRYWQLIRAENTDVCRSYELCLQAVTNTGHNDCTGYAAFKYNRSKRAFSINKT